MITVTEKAAEQIKQSARSAKMEGMPLRVAATRNPDNSIHYGIGFDDIGNQSGTDKTFTSYEVDIVVAEPSLPLVNGMTIDYVELEPDQFHFVFLNPNDPNYSDSQDAE